MISLLFVLICIDFTAKFKIKVNTSKAKIVGFFFKRKKCKNVFYYKSEAIEIVDDFSTYGKKTRNKHFDSLQAYKVMQVLSANDIYSWER